MAFRLIARAGLVAFALASGPVMLEGAVPSAQAAEKDELSNARAKFQQATEMEQAGNYTHALRVFREVGQVRMTPQVRFHIAYCEEKLGKLVAALGGYQLALAEAESLGPEFEKEVEERAVGLRSRIPKLVLARGEGAEAANIELDGISLGASSIGVEVPLDPGPHAVQAKAPGYEPYLSTIQVSEGEVERITITLNKIPVDEPSAIAAIGAPPVTVEKTIRTTRIIAYATGGLSLVAGAASLVFWKQRSNAVDDIRALCGNDRTCDNDGLNDSQMDDARNRNDKIKLYDNWLTVSLATAGASLAATGVLILVEVLDRRTQKRAATAAWTILPNAPGAELGGMSVVSTF